MRPMSGVVGHSLSQVVCWSAIAPGMPSLRSETQIHQLGNTSWRQSRTDGGPVHPSLETLQQRFNVSITLSECNRAQMEPLKHADVTWCGVVYAPCKAVHMHMKLRTNILGVRF